jgi:starvation-inducible DNA-binding protein
MNYLLCIATLTGISLLQAANQTPMNHQPPATRRALANDKVDKFFATGLAPETAQEVAHKLNVLLSSEYVLYTKTQKFHWNVVGPFFGQLHKLFNDQYDELAGLLDMIAERVRALGRPSFGTLTEFLANSQIKEDPGNNPDHTSMIKILLQDHETIIKSMRDLIDLTANLNDMATNNFLCGLVEKHEKMAWMLRAHLQ